MGRGGESQVVEDAAGGGRVLDQGDEAHRAVAARADQGVDVVGSLQETRPVEAALAASVVGSEVRRCVMATEASCGSGWNR